MSPAQAKAFESRPYAQAAIRLRRWEDQSGKAVGGTVPELAEFEHALVNQQRPRARW